MADTKISALTVATTPLAGTEVLPIVQSGVTKQVSVADLTAGRAVSASSLSLTNALTAANGGTGQSSYTVGDLLYASGATALSKLADVVTGNALISGGVGVAPSWGKIGLATHVSGTLGTANGGTGLSSFTSGGVLYANSTSALATSSSFTWSSSGGISTSNTTAGFFTQLTNGSITLREAGGSTVNNTLEAHIRPSSGKSGYVTFTEDAVDDVYAIGFAAGSQNLLFKRGGIAGTTYLTLSGVGNLYTSSGTTSMTNGFIYIPSAAGVPSGTPTSVSGRVPMYYDTTNNKFYIYNGAWKSVTLA